MGVRTLHLRKQASQQSPRLLTDLFWYIYHDSPPFTAPSCSVGSSRRGSAFHSWELEGRLSAASSSDSSTVATPNAGGPDSRAFAWAASVELSEPPDRSLGVIATRPRGLSCLTSVRHRRRQLEGEPQEPLSSRHPTIHAFPWSPTTLDTPP